MPYSSLVPYFISTGTMMFCVGVIVTVAAVVRSLAAAPTPEPERAEFSTSVDAVALHA